MSFISKLLPFGSRNSEKKVYRGKTKLSKHVVRSLKCLELSDDTLKRLMNWTDVGIDDGLDRKTDPPSVLNVTAHNYFSPRPIRTSQTLVLTFSGRVVRAGSVMIVNQNSTIISEYQKLSESTVTKTGVELFSYLAKHLGEFLDEIKVHRNSPCIPFIFVFGYPFEETAEGYRLIEWNKEVTVDDVVGEDPMLMLMSACHKEKIFLDFVSMVNDVEAVMMTALGRNGNTKIGVMIGSGTNACYIGRKRDCRALDNGEPATAVDKMVVTSNWGTLGDDGELFFIRTMTDVRLDESTPNMGKYLFEKMVSETYMGERVRLTIQQLWQSGHLLDKENPAILKKGLIQIHHINQIEQDVNCANKRLDRTKLVLAHLGYPNASKKDCAHVSYICSLIVQRSAHMVAAVTAALINRIKYSNVGVAIDGSLVHTHPFYKQMLEKKMKALVEDGIEVFIDYDCHGECGAAILCEIHKTMASKL